MILSIKKIVRVFDKSKTFEFSVRGVTTMSVKRGFANKIRFYEVNKMTP